MGDGHIIVLDIWVLTMAKLQIKNSPAMNKTIVKEQQNVNLVQTIARVTAGNLNTAICLR